MAPDLTAHLRAATGGASVRAMAERVDMVHTTLADQLRKPSPPVQTVVALCRAYGIPLAPAFIAAGYITEDEARSFSGPLALDTVTDLELAREIVRRADHSPLLNEPLDADHPALRDDP